MVVMIVTMIIVIIIIIIDHNHDHCDNFDHEITFLQNLHARPSMLVLNLQIFPHETHNVQGQHHHHHQHYHHHHHTVWSELYYFCWYKFVFHNLTCSVFVEQQADEAYKALREELQSWWLVRPLSDEQVCIYIWCLLYVYLKNYIIAPRNMNSRFFAEFIALLSLKVSI